MSQAVNLYVDTSLRQLLKSPLGGQQVPATVAPMAFNDKLSVSFFDVRKNANPSLDATVQDISAKELQLVLSPVSGVPTGGQFRLGYSSEFFALKAYSTATAATVQTALNALTTITAAGGVTVTGTLPVLRVSFNSVGARSLLQADAESLIPNTSIVVSRETTGDAVTCETQLLSFEVNVLALIDTGGWTESADAALVVSDIGGAAWQVQQVYFSPAANGGSFTLTFVEKTGINRTTHETAALAYNITVQDMQAAVDAACGSGKVSVSGQNGGPWVFTSIGGFLTEVITGDIDGIITWKGKTGTLQLNAASLLAVLTSTTAGYVDLPLSVKMRPSGGTASDFASVLPWQTVRVYRDPAPPSSTAPAPASDPTLWSWFLQVNLSITSHALLRAKVTLPVNTGTTMVTLADGTDQPIAAFSLLSSTQADDDATYFRPDDYNAATNAKVWMRTSLA